MLLAGVIGQNFCSVLDYRGEQDRKGSAFVSLKSTAWPIINILMQKKKEHGSEHWHVI